MPLNLGAQHRLSLEAMVNTVEGDPTKDFHGDVMSLKALIDRYDRGEINDAQLEQLLEESYLTSNGMAKTMHLSFLGR